MRERRKRGVAAVPYKEGFCCLVIPVQAPPPQLLHSASWRELLLEANAFAVDSDGKIRRTLANGKYAHMKKKTAVSKTSHVKIQYTKSQVDKFKPCNVNYNEKNTLM